MKQSKDTQIMDSVGKLAQTNIAQGTTAVVILGGIVLGAVAAYFIKKEGM